jgi:hypothetical protein
VSDGKPSEPRVYLEYRSDQLIKFFRDLLADVEKGNLEPVKTELRNAISKVKMEATDRGKLLGR